MFFNSAKGKLQIRVKGSNCRPLIVLNFAIKPSLYGIFISTQEFSKSLLNKAYITNTNLKAIK